MKNKINNPGLKIITNNDLYKYKGEESSPQVKNIIKWKNFILKIRKIKLRKKRKDKNKKDKNKIDENKIDENKTDEKKIDENKIDENKKNKKEKINNKKEKINNKKEDRYIIPYKEGGEIKEVERRIAFQNPYMIKNVYLLSTNYLTYHKPKRITGIDDYHDRLETIINDKRENKKRKTKYIIRTRTIKRDYNEFVNENPDNKEISVKFETNPNFMYFIIITLTNGETYIFNPFSNMTLKNYSNKGKKSYLFKLLITESGKKRFKDIINVMFKKKTNEFNDNFIYCFDIYKLDASNAKILNGSGSLTANELYSILENIINQKNENSNFSETSESDSMAMDSTSQEIVSESQISEIKDDDVDISEINNDATSKISKINNDDISKISKINNVDFLKTNDEDINSFIKVRHTSVICSDNTSLMDYSSCPSVVDYSESSFSNNDSLMDYPNVSVNIANNDNLNLSKIKNENNIIPKGTSNQNHYHNQKEIKNYPQCFLNSQEYKKIFIRCEDIVLYGEKFTNGIYNHDPLLVKFVDDDNLFVIGFYVKYPNDPFMYLIIDDTKVLRYDNEKGNVEILNEEVLKRKINQEYNKIKLNKNI